jgi:hypothetical protein
MIKLEPIGLAAALDTWALRREKVLSVLDIQAAREARAPWRGRVATSTSGRADRASLSSSSRACGSSCASGWCGS